MTIRKLIEIFKDQRKEDVVDEAKITEYVNALEAKLCEEVFLTHEAPPLRVFAFLGRPHPAWKPGDWPPFVPHEPGYSADWSFDDYLDIPLLVQPPYDDVYRAYIQWQTDLINNDTIDAGNSQRVYWQALQDFSKFWNRTHMPINKTPYRGYKE